MRDREALHDHPAHRDAQDVRPPDPDGVEHRDHVERHVPEQVLPPVELRRQPRVAVVEAQHPEAARHDALAPLRVVGGALPTEAVDEREQWCGGVAEGLVVELDGAVARGGHRVSLADARSRAGAALDAGIGPVSAARGRA